MRGLGRAVFVAVLLMIATPSARHDARARISAAASAKVRARMTPSAATPPSVSQA